MEDTTIAAVRPYVQGNKTDRTDAKGILEAYRNKDIKPVPVKQISQHCVATLHRVRSSWVVTRTARISKRGDRYLRTLLTHGARSVLWRASSTKSPDRLRA